LAVDVIHKEAAWTSNGRILYKTPSEAGVLTKNLCFSTAFLAIHWLSFPPTLWLGRPEPPRGRAFLAQMDRAMIDYIGIERIQELVRRIGVARFIEGLAAEIEADFLRWHDFDKSARHASHSAVGVIELMPISDGRLYSFKYVNGHPKNTASGLLTVTAFGVLSDVATGYPLLLSELTFTTALRTAAMSALAARWMARPSSRVMALIGNGAQSEFQAIAFHHMLGIRELRLYDVDARATAKLQRNLAELNLDGLRVVACGSTAEAVRGADIVTTVTADKRNAVILTPEMIQPGMHLNAVGGDCPGKTELHLDILRRPDAKVVVEFEPQSRIEGEVQQVEASFPVAEFAAVLRAGAIRSSDADVTIFDSVGFALEDFSALRYLHRVHFEQLGVRRELDLLPDLDDPKDLFGGLACPPSPPRPSNRPAKDSVPA
jgi:ornithine cyclodeaminase